MSTPKATKTKCRFCESEPMVLRDLRKHVADKHPEQAAKIKDSLGDVPANQHLHRGRDWGARGAGLGAEFRRRMGYGPRTGSTPEGEDKE